MVSLVDLVQTPEGTVVQVQLVFGLMMKVVPLGTVDTMGHCHKIVLEVLRIEETSLMELTIRSSTSTLES